MTLIDNFLFIALRNVLNSLPHLRLSVKTIKVYIFLVKFKQSQRIFFSNLFLCKPVSLIQIFYYISFMSKLVHTHRQHFFHFVIQNLIPVAGLIVLNVHYYMFLLLFQQKTFSITLVPQFFFIEKIFERLFRLIVSIRSRIFRFGCRVISLFCFDNFLESYRDLQPKVAFHSQFFEINNVITQNCKIQQQQITSNIPMKQKRISIVEDSDTPQQQQTQESLKNPPSSTKHKTKATQNPKISINLSDCQYPVLKLVAKMLNWKTSVEPESIDWDVWWTDNAVLPETLCKMEQYQKINHFPGMYGLARKNLLGKGLMKMRKRFTEQYNFFPLTWLLPIQYSQFKQYYQTKQKGKTRTYIVKPEALSQGKGIFLTRRIEDIDQTSHCVVQRYMHKPYLIEGLKFDFRIYVLVAGVDPFRIYLYNQGLARFATQPYIVPTKQNMEDVCMHLTNYAINKDNPNFVFNKSQTDMSIGHKRSLTSVYALLENQGVNIKTLLIKIKDIIIKTLISGSSLLTQQYRSCQPENFANNMCFEVLGFDILLNNNAEPFLLEVNHTPSFTTDTPLDELIKKNLLRDSLVLMNVNQKTKTDLINSRRQAINLRVITGKKVKLTNQEKALLKQSAQKARDQYQNANLGGFQKIYPCQNEQTMKLYKDMIKYNQDIYYQSTGITAKRMVKQIQKPVEVNIMKRIKPQMKAKTIKHQVQIKKNQQMKSDIAIKNDSASAALLPLIKVGNQNQIIPIQTPKITKQQIVEDTKVFEKKSIKNFMETKKIRDNSKIEISQKNELLGKRSDDFPKALMSDFGKPINQINLNLVLPSQAKRRGESSSNPLPKNANISHSLQNKKRQPPLLSTLLYANNIVPQIPHIASNLKQFLKY